jgi:hypothetical protein
MKIGDEPFERDQIVTYTDPYVKGRVCDAKYCLRREVKDVMFDFFEVEGQTLFCYPSETAKFFKEKV